MVSAPASSAPYRFVTQLADRAGAWDGVSLAPHSNRAVAVRMDDATIGILHHDGLLKIPVPAAIRSLLVEEDLAVPHTAEPGPDWVATRVQEESDVEKAALLLRLSYLYRRLLRSRTPTALRPIRAELAQYDLPEALATLYETMLEKRATSSPQN